MSRTEEPIKLTPAWAKLIQFCRTRLPYGEIHVEIYAGEPTKLFLARRALRFDKPETVDPFLVDTIVAGGT